MAKATIFARIKKQAELAQIYAEDGALRTAARILNELAADIMAVADQRDAALDKMIEEHVSGGTR